MAFASLPVPYGLLIPTPYLINRNEPAYFDDGSFTSSQPPVRAPDPSPCIPVLFDRGIARATYSHASSVTSVSPELADRLGLSRSRPGEAGQPELLDQPLEIRIMGRNGFVLLHYVELVVWVQHGLHATGADMQIGKLAGSCMPRGPGDDPLTCFVLEAAGRPPLHLLRLAPAPWLNPRAGGGSGGSAAADASHTLHADPAAMQQAMQLAHVRRAALPAPPSPPPCPCCTAPLWLRDPGAPLPPLPLPPSPALPLLTYLLHPEPVVFDDGSMDRHHQMPRIPARVAGAPGVVRTCYNHSTPVATVSLELAERLGLRRRRMPGPGFTGLLCNTTVPVEVLLEPLDIQLLDRSGDVLLQYTELVVFVQEHVLHSLGADLQIGQLVDSCMMGGPDRSILWTLEPEGRAPLRLPRLGPLQSRLDSPRVSGTSTFIVEPDTMEHAARLASARREVMARRARGAAAPPAGAAGRQSTGGLWLREPGAFLPSPETAYFPAPPHRAAADLATHPAPAAALVPGSAEWVAEWLPASARGRGRGRQQRSGRGGRGRGRRGGGRAVGGRSSSGRQHAAHAHNEDEEAAGEEGADGGDEEIPAAAGGQAAGGLPGPSQPPPATAAGPALPPAGAAPSAGEYEGLAPLPGDLVPAPWSALQPSTLPQDEAACTVCMDLLGSQGAGLCVQLRCRHTFCLLCLQAWLDQRLVSREVPSCPTCRSEITY